AHARLFKLGNQCSQMFRHYIFKHNLTLSNRTGNHEGACFYTVWYDCMFSSSETLDTFDGDMSRTGASDTAAHRVDIVGKIHYFRFTGNIFKMCRPFCQAGCHNQILCGSDAWKIEVDLGSLQAAVCRALKAPIHRPEGDTHFFKPFDMLLYRS